MGSFFDDILPAEQEEPLNEEEAAPAGEHKESSPKKKPAKKKGMRKVRVQKEKKGGRKDSKQDEGDLAFKQQGELAVDFYQTEDSFVIQAPIGGVSADDLDVSVENGVVSISGTRQNPSEDTERSYYTKECHWGAFARQVLLPEEVDPEEIEAALKEGILTLRLRRSGTEKTTKIIVEEED